MAHVGQELGLGAVGRFGVEERDARGIGGSLGLLLGRDQRHFGELALDDIAELIAIALHQGRAFLRLEVQVEHGQSAFAGLARETT